MIFALIELLAVIGLLGIIIVLAVPNLLYVFSANKSTLSNIQKNQLKSAVEMYINDYCTEPISDSYTCTNKFTTTIDNTTGIIKVTNGTISLSEFDAISDYFDDKTITNNCSGNISITNGEVNLDNITCNFNK